MNIKLMILTLTLMLATRCSNFTNVNLVNKLGSAWVKDYSSTYSGLTIASDPSVLLDTNTYHLFYTDLNVGLDRTYIAKSTSVDGKNWSASLTVISGINGRWDENIESPEIIKHSNEYLLFYSGYSDTGGALGKGFPAALGLATSSDGISFTRYQTTAILNPTPGWYDGDAIYSPTVIHDGTQFQMIYTGHCYTACNLIDQAGVYLLGASSFDGRVWTKWSSPIHFNIKPSWIKDGAAEPSLIKHPTKNSYILFITGLSDENRSIGVAYSDELKNTWSLKKEPVIQPTINQSDSQKVLAPDVIALNDDLIMWYSGLDNNDGYRIHRADTKK